MTATAGFTRTLTATSDNGFYINVELDFLSHNHYVAVQYIVCRMLQLTKLL